MERIPFQIIETAGGRAVGYLAPNRDLGWGGYGVIELAVVEGQSLRAVMPSVLRALKMMAEAEAAAQNTSMDTLSFKLGSEHPAFDAAPDLLHKTRPPYAWYIRVADVPAFLRRIAPALETRLARSPLAGHTGALRIDEYQSGFRLILQQGKIKAIEPWQCAESEEPSATFPPLVFLQLLFGYRPLAQLRTFYADCRVQDKAEPLLNVLFPQAQSCVIPVG